jgi:predicted dehydrogenase
MKKNNNSKDQKKPDLSKLKFVKQVGVATAAFTVVPRNVMGGNGYQAPSDTVNVAGIGVGAQGGGDIQQVCTPDVPVVRPQRTSSGLPLTADQIAAQAAQQAARQAQQAAAAAAAGTGAVANANAAVQMGAAGTGKVIKLANIYALCDTDSNYAGYIFKGYPKAKIYNDWRKMLEKEKSIDAVLIGTPDHNHATIAAHFMREKKHIYVEKPMCKTIKEVRTLMDLAKQYDVVTQMGNQGHATEGTRRTVEWVQGGVVGLVHEVHLSTNRPAGMWKQGNYPRLPAVKVPKTLNYDVWTGPAPNKPYNPESVHFNWRGLWDYGTGAMGDMGAHIFDAPIWALNLGYPTKIQATTSPYSTEYLPECEIVTYEFPARGYMPAVKVTWRDGGLLPPRPDTIEAGRQVRDALYLGDKGIMMHASHGAMPELVPADKTFVGPDPWLARTGNIFEDWIGAIKGGTKSCNDFSISGKLTEIMLLTNIAVQTKPWNITLEYDAANMKITNNADANKFFHYEYRTGWTL